MFIRARKCCKSGFANFNKIVTKPNAPTKNPDKSGFLRNSLNGRDSNSHPDESG